MPWSRCSCLAIFMLEKDIIIVQPILWKHPREGNLGRLDAKTEISLVDSLEERTRCLDITFEDQPVEADVEEAYIQGEALTPPEIQFSEDGDMDDDYWTWDQKSQRFRHWDAERGEWFYFPERFD
ncbi:hypothetical protein F52700_2143 [Fusarium sp. NRRL 52700]|nr:hypothetical protein F52700_2143 [Fusarium sp. NRRL 52700]